ncbi:T9SS type A sorting domain-containing protein [Chryseobacterium soli]|nr:T9SS type A sorting domain-containing protein [Chryseobacterium soli]
MFGNLHFTMRKIGAALGLLSIAGSYTYAQQWENVGGVQTVSAGGSSFNNLVVDNAGNYYLSYYDVTVSKGSVQKFNGNFWSYIGGSAGITTSYATYSSLSLDPAGNTIYYTNMGSGLEVRQFNGTTWTSLPSVTTATTNYQASAVSPSNVLFTYGSYGSGTVKRYVNGAWEQVGNAGFSEGAEFAEMVIGSNNIVYTSNVSNGLRVYQNSVTASAIDNWALVGGSIVDAASSGESYSSDIAIDANNNVYVAYVSTTAAGKKLNVKKFDGTSWTQVGNANFSNGKVQHVALAVTASGTPYVAASRWEDDNFLKNTVYKLDAAGQDWVTFGSDFISDGEAKYNDLAVDNTNNFLILAYTDGSTKVKRISLANISQTCSNTDPGNNAGDTGCVTFTYQGQPVTYSTVRGSDGKVWMQQNLGSSQVAISMGDTASFGDLFQWGRWDDGHQLRTSATTTATSPNSPDGLAGTHSYVIGSPSWWGTNIVTDKWTASNAAAVTTTVGADPCKAAGSGWRLPSQAEWAALVSAEGIANPGGAYSSHLKLPAGGYRSSSDGGFTFAGQRGYFWSSETSSTGGKYLYIGSTLANASSGAPRGQGASVRCIKDGNAVLGTSDVKLNPIVGVYPNPTNGILYIKADAAIESVSVINVVGERIKAEFSNNQIDMQSLPGGVYIIELKLKNGQSISKKIIKN